VTKFRDMTEIYTDYLERALPWQTWLAARWHLFLCSMCRAYYDQLAKTRRLLQGRSLPGPAAAVESDLLASRGPDPDRPPPPG